MTQPNGAPAEPLDAIGDGIAVQALTRKSPEPNTGLVVYAQYLEASARELVAARSKPAIEQQLRWALAQAHGVVAYLLWALHDNDQGAASDAGWEITEMCEAGEPMADWVTEQLVKLGVDVEALITDAELTETTAKSTIVDETELTLTDPGTNAKGQRVVDIRLAGQLAGYIAIDNPHHFRPILQLLGPAGAHMAWWLNESHNLAKQAFELTSDTPQETPTYAQQIATELLNGCTHGQNNCLCKIGAQLANKQPTTTTPTSVDSAPVGVGLGVTEPARDGAELPEDAARRFANELWALGSGLADRGVPLQEGLSVDAVMVPTALAEIDRLRSGLGAMARQQGKILSLCAAAVEDEDAPGWFDLDPEAVRAALSSPESAERGPDTPEDELLRAAAWCGAQELEDLGDEADDGDRAGQRLLVLAVDEPVGSVWRAAMLDMVRAAATEEGLDLVAEWRAAQAEDAAEQLTDNELDATGGDPAPCCDLHGRNCEPPSELCCERCTEAAHDTFPIRHADGSTCSAPDLSRTEVDHG